MNPRAILLMLIAFVVVAFASMLYPANAQLNDLTLLKSTPTAQLLPLITANNVSRVRLQKVIGHSVIPRGPYLPYGGITLVFSPKGTYLATDYNSPGTLQIWSVKSGKRIAALSGHHVRVAQAVFTPDENKIITVDDYGNIRIWSLASFTAITVDVHGDTLVVSANGKTFAVGQDRNTVALVDVKTGKTKQVLSGNSKPVGPDLHFNKLEFSLDGASLVAVANDEHGGFGDDAFLNSRQAILILWNLQTGQPILELSGDYCTLNFWVSFDVAGKLLIASSSRCPPKDLNSSNSVRLWDAISQHEGASISAYGVSHVSFSKDGKYLVVDENSIIAIWDTSQAEPFRIQAIPFPPTKFNADGSLILSGPTLREAGTGKDVSPWPDSLFVLDAALSPDGKTIGLLVYDSTLQLWSVR